WRRVPERQPEVLRPRRADVRDPRGARHDARAHVGEAWVEDVAAVTFAAHPSLDHCARGPEAAGDVLADVAPAIARRADPPLEVGAMREEAAVDQRCGPQLR